MVFAAKRRVKGHFSLIAGFAGRARLCRAFLRPSFQVRKIPKQRTAANDLKGAGNNGFAGAAPSPFRMKLREKGFRDGGDYEICRPRAWKSARRYLYLTAKFLANSQQSKRKGQSK